MPRIRGAHPDRRSTIGGRWERSKKKVKKYIEIQDSKGQIQPVPNLENIQLKVHKFEEKQFETLDRMGYYNQIVLVFSMDLKSEDKNTMYFNLKNYNQHWSFEMFRTRIIIAAATQFACRQFGQHNIDKGPIENRPISRKITTHWHNQWEWDGVICAAQELMDVQMIMES
jgi:hypothetical protein